MNLQTEIFGDVIVVHAPEQLETDHCDRFESFAASLDRSRVVLDLNATRTLDSRGLETLLNVHDKLRGAAGAMKIATSDATNQKILEITRLDQQLEVFDSVVEAVKSFR